MSTKKRYFDLKDLEKKYGKLSVGEFLRSWRLCDELSQKQFARKLKMSPANLCDIEKGRKGLSLEKVYEVAEVIGYPPDVLLKIALEEQVEAAGLKYSVEIKPAA